MGENCKYNGGNNLSQNVVELVILQSRSPSCGSIQIYDGSFSGKRVDGQGVFAKMLTENGIQVLDVEDLTLS